MRDVSASGYDPDRSFERHPEPDFSYEIELVSGEEGRELRLEQARAIRELLLWTRSRRLGPEESKSGYERRHGGET